MKRLTPEIVIPPMEIKSCSECSFFEDNVNDYGEHFYYCQKSPYHWDDMNGFHKPETIWVECPLPVIEE